MTRHRPNRPFSTCPHTYGVRLPSYTAITTEPCRPTACVCERPCPPDWDCASFILNSEFCILNWSFTFSAKERDSETGLSYFGSRYYSSDLSIWLSVDPMSDKYASLSPYVYCANNPVKLVDPNGEELKLALRGQYDNTDNQDNNNINLSNSQNLPTINWYALTPAQIAQLQTIAERNTGRASVMAKGVLCFFFGICYEDVLFVDGNTDNPDNDDDAENRSAKTVQQEGETNLNIYPNPTSGEITIQHASLPIREVEVSDVFGKLLARVSVDDFQTNLDMSPYASGVYFVRVITEQGVVTKRVVKR